MLITCPKCSVQYKIPEGVHIPAGKKMKCSNCQHMFVLNAENPQEVVEETPVDLSQPVDVNPVMEDEIASTSVFAEDDTFKPEELPQPFMPLVPAVIEEKRTVGVWALIISVLLLVSLAVVGVVYRDVLFGSFISAKSVPVTQSVSPRRSQSDVRSQKIKAASGPMRSGENYIEETPQIVMLPQIQSVRFEKKQGEDLEISIEGILKNPTTQRMKLPKKVRAFAYDTQGKVLFEKDIYLTDTSLKAGETLPFFGTYQPAPQDVQWIDVTF